jgi:hypothetical protein
MANRLSVLHSLGEVKLQSVEGGSKVGCSHDGKEGSGGFNSDFSRAAITILIQTLLIIDQALSNHAEPESFRPSISFKYKLFYPYSSTSSTPNEVNAF